MRLFKDIMEKRLDKKNFYELRRFYLRAFWEHLQIFAIAVSVLNIQITKKEIRRRNKLYKNILLKGTTTEQDIRRINKIMNKDFKTISDSINYIQKLNEVSVSYGSFYQPGRVAVDMDEFPID